MGDGRLGSRMRVGASLEVLCRSLSASLSLATEKMERPTLSCYSRSHEGVALRLRGGMPLPTWGETGVAALRVALCVLLDTILPFWKKP